MNLMPFLNLDGQRVYYADHQRDQSGPVFIMLHGAGGSHLVWPGELRRLPGRRTICLDLPGHGLSDPPGRRAIGHYSAIIISFIEVLKLERVVLLGHSMGGAIALETAMTHHPAVRGLIILGASARLRVAKNLLFNCHEDIDQVAQFIVENGFSQPNPVLQNKAYQQIKAISPVTIYGDFLACERFDRRDRLSDIPQPALIISGTADRLTPHRHVAALAEGLPNARLSVLEGDGHYMMLERPVEVAALVESFPSGLNPL